ncbi:UNVERIFIED_CONTAM: hypothetical protein FKN15_045787 [Acipenser sinensis]
MNVQPCARCGFVVYPAEKISCIDQNWHKACFHCEICKMILTANNFVSHQKKPYCQVHNPKNNDFTSVYETPANINAKKQSEAISEKTYQAEHEEQKSWYKGTVNSPGILRVAQAQNTISDVDYKRGHEDRVSKFTSIADTRDILHAQAGGQLASDLEYKRGHGERVSQYTSVTDTPEVLLAKAGGRLASDYAYTEQYEQHRGKGSFPALITPAYQSAKKASELASGVKYHEQYEKELKGKGCSEASGAEIALARENADRFSQVKYKQSYQNQMKGHYEGVGMDRRTLHAMKVRNLASNIAYKSDYENDKNEQTDYNYPATMTPSYKTQKKLEPLKDVNYRQHVDKLTYSSVTDTPDIVQAKINAHQLSNLNYRAQYEKTKTNFTLPQDIPHLKKAKANAELYSGIKYKEDWEKTKSKACEMTLDNMSLLAAKASRDLASDIKYREAYEKMKDKAVGASVSDSKTLHSLQAAKMSSEIAYRKGSKETQSQFHLPLDMLHLSHAKKAQSLASETEYRKRLHEYTVLPDDMKVKWAKKAYRLQSESQYKADLSWMKGVGWVTEGSLDVQQAKKAGDLLSEKKYRQKVDELKFTQVADTLNIKHAKKSQEMQSELVYKAGTEQTLHQYTMNKDEPLFRQAKANAEYLSQKSYKNSWEKQKGKGFELRMDALSILAAKSKRDLASDIKYREDYEKTKGVMIGVKDVKGDSQMAHSTRVSRLHSDLQYKKEYEDNKTKYSTSLDMLTLAHAKKAQGLATDQGYKTFLHHYTSVPTDTKLEWAKKAYGIQSDNQYKSDLNWMKGVGWAAAGSLDVEQARKAGDLISERKYRQHAYALKHTSIKDTPEMIQAKISYNQAVDRLYKEQGESVKHHYTMTNNLPEHLQAKLNAMNLSEACYKQSWTKLRDAGYKLGLDAIPFQAAKASGEMISDYKYKEAFEKTKGRMVGLRGLEDDINISHSVHAGKLQSDVSMKHIAGYKLGLDAIPFQAAKASGEMISDYKYKEAFEKTKGRMVGLRGLEDDVNISHSVHAGKLQSDLKYRKDSEKTRSQFHLPMDMMVLVHAKKAQSLASDQDYKYMLHQYTSLPDDLKMQWAKKAYELQSELKYRKDSEKTRSQFHLPMDMMVLVHAKKAQSLASDQDYKYMLHQYTSLPDDLKMQWAKKAYELQSERLYKEAGEHARHHYTPTLGQPELNQAKINAANFSESKYRQSWLDLRAQGYKLTMDAIPFQAAKASGDIASDYQYKHNFVLEKGKHIGARSILDDPKLLHCMQMAKLQSEQQYKKESRDTSSQFHLAMDMVNLVHAKKAQALASNQDYKTKVHAYTVLPDDMKVQWAKKAYKLQSEYQYKHNFVLEKGKHIGARSILDDPKLLHCMQMAKLQSEQQYKKESRDTSSQFHLAMDMVNLVHAKKAQALASNQDYKTKVHAYTVLPDDMKVQWAKKAYKLQSEKLYKSDLNFMKGVGWITAGTPQIETAKRAGELISEKNYRQHPGSLQFTSVADSPDLLHARNSYLQCSERLYKSGDSESMHRCTLPPDHPDFIRARLNAQHISDKAYKTSWDQIRSARFDFRLDAIPFQTAKASREIASDFRYKEAFVKDKGQQIGFRCVDDDPKMKHFLSVSKLQSNNEYKKHSEETRSQYKSHSDQPGFLQAKKSQEQASDLSYRQHLHQYTCDPEQLNLKHAKQAYKLQSDVNYKSDLSWMRGIGWTPPGSHKVEMARRAAELGYAQGLDLEHTAAQHEQHMRASQQKETREEFQQEGVNLDATEILHVKRKKVQMNKKTM